MERNAGGLMTGIYRQATHTDRYIHFDSHHHPRVKSETIKCLRNRIDRICENTI